MLFAPQCVIVKSTIPHQGLLGASQCLCRSRLEAIHYDRESIALSESNQAMPMVGHQHPTQQPRIAPALRIMHASTHCPGEFEIPEYRSAISDDSGHEIDVARNGHTSSTRGAITDGGLHTANVSSAHQLDHQIDSSFDVVVACMSTYGTASPRQSRAGCALTGV